MIEIRTVPGDRAPGDRKCQIRTADGAWETITIQDQLEIFKAVYDNEEIIKPRARGYQGGMLLLNAMADVASGISPHSVWRKVKGSAR